MIMIRNALVTRGIGLILAGGLTLALGMDWIASPEVVDMIAAAITGVFGVAVATAKKG